MAGQAHHHAGRGSRWHGDQRFQRHVRLSRGLSGVFVVAAVVASATWIRTLDARAWLPRRAAWLFLMPAAASAAVSSFRGGSQAGILAAVAVILTVGAVLLTGSLSTASDLVLPLIFYSGWQPSGSGWR